MLVNWDALDVEGRGPFFAGRGVSPFGCGGGGTATDCPLEGGAALGEAGPTTACLESPVFVPREAGWAKAGGRLAAASS